MAIPDHARANFETLLRAAQAGDLALMCQSAFNRDPLSACKRDPFAVVRIG